MNCSFILPFQSGFLSHSVYSRLLEKMIGDTAVSVMKQAPSEGEALSVSLSQVFPTLTEEVTPSESKSKLKMILTWNISSG